MLDLLDDLGHRAARALGDTLGGDPTIAVSRSTRAEFGDLQIAAAMALGKQYRKPPRQLAEIIRAAVAQHPAVEAASLAGPGFVNLRLRDGWIAERVAQGPKLRPIGRRLTVVLDYSSPNVAKPMHIAHIRSTIIGEALKRTLRALDYHVIADNHVGDWGTQFGKLIVAYRHWVDARTFAERPVDELLRLYLKFTDEERRQAGAAAPPDEEAEEPEDDTAAPPILREARAELVKLQQGDPENLALWQTFVEASRREFDRVYQRLGVSFDVMLGESFYRDRLAATVEELCRLSIARESRGAMVVFFNKEQDGEELPPFLIRKADGGYNYATTDVAALGYRVDRWQPARILIVTDERQQLHFRQLFAVGRRLGITCSLEHIWFGLMRLPEGTISTREGKLIGLEALLDEAERRASVLAGEHSPELAEPERREVARVVGIGAVKYNDLSRDRQTLVTFSWDKALSLTGNTAPYLQYAYARLRSILRKADAGGARPGTLGPLSPVERELALRLLWFPDAVEQVARTARPHLLTDYLFDLASAFSTFYTEHPVLKAEPAVRASRLTLTDQVGQTLRRGLELLGIDVLERM